MNGELNSQPTPLEPTLIMLVPTEVSFIYERDEGEEFIGVVMDDPRLGQILLMLKPVGAAHVGTTLLAMASGLPKLRAQYDADNEGQP